MKKLFTKFFALLIIATSVMFTACDKQGDELGEKVNVQIKVTPAVEGAIAQTALDGMDVVFTEVRNQQSTTGILDSTGVATVELTKGTYNISIEETIKNAQDVEVVVSLRMENVAVTLDGQVIEGKVNSLPKNALGADFIFSEIFFNGETNSGQMMHPDQYIVVFNPTEKTLYADGLCVATTQHMSREDKTMWYDLYYPTKVPMKGFITIPGNGQEHPVLPGEKFVIAFTATDHSKVEGYEHAVDLSGADYEIFYGADANDIDNPGVENVLLTSGTNNGSFSFQPRGYYSPLMFRLADGRQETIDAFVKANTSRAEHLVKGDPKKGTEDQVIEIDIVSVMTENIIDGVQTSDVPQDVKTRVIPETVDRGKFLVSGCHRQELAIRKTIKVGEAIFYQDTNNSTEDFVMQKGQNSFPIGWRNK